MTPEQFQDKLAEWQRGYESQKSVILEEIGNKAVELFRQNFDNEGFFGQAWRQEKASRRRRTQRYCRKTACLSILFR
jgi:hypothetical protein